MFGLSSFAISSFGLHKIEWRDFVGLWATSIPKVFSSLVVVSDIPFMHGKVILLLIFVLDFVSDDRCGWYFFDEIDWAAVLLEDGFQVFFFIFQVRELNCIKIIYLSCKLSPSYMSQPSQLMNIHNLIYWFTIFICFLQNCSVNSPKILKQCLENV